MSFNKFKETNETNEATDNKESSVENNKKHRSQILAAIDEYNDNFDKKMDSMDKKNENSDKPKEQENSGSENGHGLFNRIKDFFAKEKADKQKTQETSESTDEPPQKRDRAKEFRNSLKPTMTEEETEKYNEEHGYSSKPTERAKGGVDRERVLGSEDPRYYAFEDDSDNDTKNNNNA